MKNDVCTSPSSKRSAKFRQNVLDSVNIRQDNADFAKSVGCFVMNFDEMSSDLTLFFTETAKIEVTMIQKSMFSPRKMKASFSKM